MSGLGLSERELELIRAVFRGRPSVECVKVYGSRAMGTARANSDIDLAVFGAVDGRQVRSIHHELDELPLPYLFDVAAYAAISDDDLKRHIDRDGRTIYQCKQSMD